MYNFFLWIEYREVSPHDQNFSLILTCLDLLTDSSGVFYDC